MTKDFLLVGDNNARYWNTNIFGKESMRK